jgi:hypothetical protein
MFLSFASASVRMKNSVTSLLLNHDYCCGQFRGRAVHASHAPVL